MGKKLKNMLIMLGLPSDVIYNSAVFEGGRYSCGSCNSFFLLTEHVPMFCPVCGVSFKDLIDLSI